MGAAFNFNTTPSIIFGAGTINQIGEIAIKQLGPRILLITDAGLVRAGLIRPAVDALEAAGVVVAVFDAVTSDPAEAVIMSAMEAGKAHKAAAVIGLGGGSSLDVAKLVALLLRSGEKLADVYGVGQAKGPRLPLMLIPTTAGTGSEVTPISIVTTGEIEKKGVVSQLLLPDIALLDPELTLGLPALVTAATGMDAMVHAIEAFTSASPNNNPVSKALAREALALLGRHIRRAASQTADHCADIEARSSMLLGSMLAGQSFANSPVAAVHALAYPIGGIFHVPHGLSNTLVLPHVISFNSSHCTSEYAELAGILFPETARLDPATRAKELAPRLAGLARDIGLATRLRDVDIPANALPKLAAEAMKQTRLLVNNPRKVSEADALMIYKAAW